VESFSSTTDIPDIPNIAPDQLFITHREGSLWRRGTSKDVLKTTRDKKVVSPFPRSQATSRRSVTA